MTYPTDPTIILECLIDIVRHYIRTSDPASLLYSDIMTIYTSRIYPIHIVENLRQRVCEFMNSRTGIENMPHEFMNRPNVRAVLAGPSKKRKVSGQILYNNPKKCKRYF